MPESRTAAPDGRLARLIYRSHSLLPDSADERTSAMSELLRIARRNNEQIGLTGVLLFDGANFLQAIEGGIDHVQNVYESIACDLRHEDIELIEFKPIAARDYQFRPMAYIEGLSAERATLHHLLSALTAAKDAGTDGDADFAAG